MNSISLWYLWMCSSGCHDSNASRISWIELRMTEIWCENETKLLTDLFSTWWVGTAAIASGYCRNWIRVWWLKLKANWSWIRVGETWTRIGSTSIELFSSLEQAAHIVVVPTCCRGYQWLSEAAVRERHRERGRSRLEHRRGYNSRGRGGDDWSRARGVGGGAVGARSSAGAWASSVRQGTQARWRYEDKT